MGSSVAREPAGKPSAPAVVSPTTGGGKGKRPPLAPKQKAGATSGPSLLGKVLGGSKNWKAQAAR